LDLALLDVLARMTARIDSESSSSSFVNEGRDALSSRHSLIKLVDHLLCLNQPTLRIPVDMAVSAERLAGSPMEWQAVGEAWICHFNFLSPPIDRQVWESEPYQGGGATAEDTVGDHLNT
jgi:hypothetical protein